MFDFQGFMQFANNPQAYIQKMGIPNNVGNNPDDIIQYMMNSGKLSQQQYNSMVQQANAIQKMPYFSQFIQSHTTLPH